MKLFYREEGSGYPLIILHGLYGASDNWLPVAHLLSPFFRVILPDLRNHGRSPHHPLHTYDALAEDITELTNTLRLPVKPHLIGHSMGGKVLMRLLLTEPQTVAKAAVLDIAPKTYPPENHDMHRCLLETMTRIAPEHYQHREDIHAAVRQLLPSETLCQIVFKNICKIEDGFRWKINIEAIQKNRQTILSWQLPADGQTYPFPVLFLRGEHSTHISDDDIPAIRSLFPAAEIQTLPGASHFLHKDQPTLLSQHLLRFFCDNHSMRSSNIPGTNRVAL